MVILFALVALAALFYIPFYLVRSLIEWSAKNSFCKRYNLDARHFEGMVVRKRQQNGPGQFSLEFPRWKNPRANGCQDHRFKNNMLQSEHSTLHVGGYLCRSRDIFMIYLLAVKLRRDGNEILSNDHEIELQRELHSSDLLSRFPTDAQRSKSKHSVILDRHTK